MAKIPVKLLMDGAIKYGPKVGKFVIDNAGKIAVAYNVAQNAADTINKKKNDKITQGNVHYRKVRHDKYKKDVLNNLEKKNRNDLSEYRTEINQFIEQIKVEQAKEVAVKKPVHAKRMKNWEAILLQIESKINLKDYQEYLTVYNNPAHDSTYFNGFETTLLKFKKIIEKDSIQEIRDFVRANTNISEEMIKRDFI